MCSFYLLCKMTTTGANGRFNISSLLQTQSSTGNLEAKAWTVSNSSLKCKCNQIQTKRSGILI